jgi:SAM-dependent methyltransferase
VSDASDHRLALSRAPYGNDEEVGRITASIISAGHSILQIHRMGESDDEHVAALLSIFNPKHGAMVLDAGCGVGEVARLMKIARPDLSFSLLNISATQLALCPEGMERIRADFHRIPADDESFDAVMFNYSLGHGLLAKSIAEARRVLKPGGVLFIYDLAADDSSRLIETLGYKAHPKRRVEVAAKFNGFRVDLSGTPTTSIGAFMKFIDPTTYAEIFAGVTPAIYRFTRC